MEVHSTFPLELELRQVGDRPTISGIFPYNQLATVRSTGRVRKERLSSRAFDFSVNQEPAREINFLYGHSMNRPLASRNAGSFELEDTADALSFMATLPPASEQTSWQRDFILAQRSGLIGGVSPGFTVPPNSIVAGAESFVAEIGNPSVFIREIRHAVLYELSAVTRPAYQGTALLERAEDVDSRHYWNLNLELMRWL